MFRIIFIIIITYALFSCKGSGTKDGIHYGAEITEEGAIGIAEVLAKVDTDEELSDFDAGEGNIVKAVATKVEGKVSEICKSSGCWLKVATEDGKEIFVDTDHKFFVPIDIIGKSIIAEGNAYKSITSVAELQHYAKDEGLSSEDIEKITEPQSEYKIIAKGLIIKQ